MYSGELSFSWNDKLINLIYTIPCTRGGVVKSFYQHTFGVQDNIRTFRINIVNIKMLNSDSACCHVTINSCWFLPLNCWSWTHHIYFKWLCVDVIQVCRLLHAQEYRIWINYLKLRSFIQSLYSCGIWMRKVISRNYAERLFIMGHFLEFCRQNSPWAFLGLQSNIRDTYGALKVYV